MADGWLRGILGFALLLLFGIGPPPHGALAQDAAQEPAEKPGAITGVVVDAKQGEPLPGANVSIKGTTTGTSTDLKGRYRLDGLAPGTYDIVYSFVGFQQKTITGVEVQAGQNTELEITLAEETEQLDEVIIEAEAARDSEAGMLKERAKAAAMSNAISAEAISEAGAGDAASAMKNVTGASVVGGKYVVMRGMGDRYTNTQLNSAELPSSDPDRNSVQLDLFPSSLIDNIVTKKTFTPDSPANFSGGLVNINTKSFPEELTVKFSASTEFNTQTDLQRDNFILYSGGNTSLLGFDGGPSIPDELKDLSPGNIPNPLAASDDPEAASQLDRMSDAFNNVMAPTSKTPPVQQSYSFSAGNQFQVFGRPLGVITGLTYKRNASFYDDGKQGRFFFSGGGGGTSTLTPRTRVNEKKGKTTTDFGGIFNLSYKLTPNHEIGVNTLYSRTAEATARTQEGFFFSFPESTFLSQTLDFTERGVYSIQPHGEHRFGALFGGTTVDWNASVAQTEQRRPDFRKFAYLRRERRGEVRYIAGTTNFDNPSRIFRTLSERAYSAELNVSIPVPGVGGSGEVKFGGTLRTTDRSFSETLFDYTPESGSFNGNPTDFFSDASTGLVDTVQTADGRDRFRFNNAVSKIEQPGNSYEGDRTIWSAYAMTDIPIRSFRVITGVRMETTDLSVTPTLDDPERVDDLSGRIDEVSFFPSLNLVYNVRENMNIRGAVTRTVARPSFREFAPFSNVNFINDFLLIGNPDLKITTTLNADLRWEWFPNPGEIAAVSLFYKDLDDPIERTILGGTNGQRSFANTPNGTVYGVEMEVDKRLDIIAPTLRNFSVGGNVSLIQSEVDIPDRELKTRRAIDPDASATRQLQGQSPFLVNANVTYENRDTGTNASAYFNVIGERLSEISLGGVPDVYEQPAPDLDITFSQRLLRNWRVSVSAEDLLNPTVKKTHELDNGEEFTFESFRHGRTFSLGVEYSIR